jgi:hypothetical protein
MLATGLLGLMLIASRTANDDGTGPPPPPAFEIKVMLGTRMVGQGTSAQWETRGDGTPPPPPNPRRRPSGRAGRRRTRNGQRDADSHPT